MSTQPQFISAAASLTLASRATKAPTAEIAASAEARLGRKAKVGRHVDWDAVNALVSELSERGYASDRVLQWVPHYGATMRKLTQAWLDRAAQAGVL